MKKKVLALVLSLALVVVAAVGGTMAYFTDKDTEENVFTVGNVKIDLIEKQRNEDGTALEPFVDGKILMPIVGSAQTDPKDALGLTTAKNYVDKIITIKNTGHSAAYIRAYFAIPSALDDGYDSFNAGMNTLHFNFGNFKHTDGKFYTTYENQWSWKNANDEWKYFETTIDNVAYNVYFADYHEALAPGDTTEQFISGVYLDKNVDMDESGKYIDPRHSGADLSILEGDVKCPVFAVAVQAAGFDDVESAVTEAFGSQYNPWNGAVENWRN